MLLRPFTFKWSIDIFVSPDLLLASFLLFSFYFLHDIFSRFCFLGLFFKLFIYSWLHWAVTVARGPSLIGAGRGHSSLRCWGCSWRLLFSQSTGSGHGDSGAVAHGLGCSVARGILQGSNPCPLRRRRILIPCTTRETPVPSCRSLGCFL